MPLNKQQHHFSSLTDLPSHTSISYRDSNSVIPDSLYEAGFLGELLACALGQKKSLVSGHRARRCRPACWQNKDFFILHKTISKSRQTYLISRNSAAAEF